MQQLRHLLAAPLAHPADHAEVDHPDASVVQVEDVARVRVRVEQAVFQHHLEHDAGAGAGQLVAVQAGGVHRGQVASGNAVHEVLHVEPLAGPAPVDAGDGDALVVLEVLRDPLGVAALGGEIQLGAQRAGELLHHPGRPVTAQVGHLRLDDLRSPHHQPQVGLDHLADARPAHLEDHRAAVFQPGAVGLRQRRGRERPGFDAGEHLLRFAAQVFHQLRADFLPAEGRHRVLQLAQLGDPLGRQQVDAGGQHLAELDEGRAQFLQRLAEAHRRLRPFALLVVADVQ